ncbi:unnamed protein product [Rotaria sp. Silwood1]|nr:unnamed protein product [Rotaria sp. Silwood1]CAF4818019.1 unnamed protein product [Rotaria sp. Silwood1]
MLEIDNQRLYTENDQLKETNCQTHNHEEIILREKNAQLEKLINSLQRSNQQPLCDQGIDSTVFESKIKTLENDIDFYKHRSDQQEIEIRRLVNELNTEREQHKNELDTYRKNIISDEIDKLRSSLNNSEQQCNLLRLELQRLQTEKEILKVRLIEEKILDSPTSEIKEIDNINYEKFIRNELDINIDQANKLINHSNCHKKILEEKIQQLTNEINQLKKENKTNNVNDLSIQIYQYNENILHAKREMNKLQMEITDKNTIIYNLYKKIECLEQALMISKQRMNAQLNEIEKHIPIFIDGLSTDDQSQICQSIDLNKNLCTSSPIKSADINSDISSSSSTRCQNHEQLSSDHRNFLSH